MASLIPTFFYGSFINLDVLRRGGFEPSAFEVCVLDGYDINIENLATLVRATNASVYGILAKATQAELSQLYGQNWLGATYAPEPVAVRSLDGALKIALCFIAEKTPAWPLENYLDWILIPAKQLGFPDSYVERIARWQRRP